MSHLYRQGNCRYLPYPRRQFFRASELGFEFNEPQRPYPGRQGNWTGLALDTDNSSKVSDPFMAQGVIPFVAPAEVKTNTPIGGCLGLFAQWEATLSDAWVIDTVRFHLSLDFLSTSLSFFIRCSVSNDTIKRDLMDLSIQHLLDIQAIQLVPQDQHGQGFYSILFMVPKNLGGWRPILDL